MAKADRIKNRQRRTIPGTRTPDLGYYMILTDTEETEQNYLYGLRDSLPEAIRNRLVIKVLQADLKNIVNKCLTAAAQDVQFRELWVVIDRDKVENFDKLIQNIELAGAHAGWSNPCIEVWFSAYFDRMLSCYDSVTCCQRFGELYLQRTGREYKKADQKIYDILNRFGDEAQAVQRADSRLHSHDRGKNHKPSEMCPATTLHYLVREIRAKGKPDT